MLKIELDLQNILGDGQRSRQSAQLEVSSGAEFARLGGRKSILEMEETWDGGMGTSQA